LKVLPFGVFNDVGGYPPSLFNIPASSSRFDCSAFMPIPRRYLYFFKIGAIDVSEAFGLTF
jgi:hypothetical protein